MRRAIAAWWTSRTRYLKQLAGLERAEDRGAERLRRARLTSVTSIAVQGISILAGFVSVPLSVGYLGPERYGIWLTLNSLLMWLAISDLALGGNTLISAMADASGQENQRWASELASTAFWSLVAIAAGLSLVFAAAFPFIAWDRLLNVTSPQAVAELPIAVIIAFAGFALAFPAGIVMAIYHGHQEGYVGNVWNIAGSLMSLLALIGVTHVHGGLPHLVFAFSGARLLVSGLSAVYLFGWRRPWLAPHVRLVSRRAFRHLGGLGVKFLAAQLAGLGMYQSQPMIIAQILGPAQVGVFNVAQRLITLPLTIIQVVFTPLMPAYAEAAARGDWRWISRTLRRSLGQSALATAVMILAVAPATRALANLWVGPSLVPSWSLVASLSCYVMVVGIVSPASVMLYGVGRVGGQALIAMLNAVLTVCLGIWLTQRYGLEGMGIAMALAFAIGNLPAQMLQIRAELRAHASA